MMRGFGVMLCYQDAGSFLPPALPFTDSSAAIDTNINSSIEKDHFDEETYSRLQ